MPTKYYFKDDRAPFVPNRHLAKPEVIGGELARIKKIYGDTQPETVWKQAQNPRNPLHKHFTWNERKAAEAHWRAEARELIGCIELVSNRQPERTMQSVSISNPVDGRRYYESVELLDDRHLRLALWQDALRELEAFLKRFAKLQKLCQVAARTRKTIDAEIAKLKASIAAGGP